MKMTQVYDTGSGSLAGTTARIVDGVMIVGKRITKNNSKTIKQIFQRDKQKFVREVADSVKIDIIDNFWPKPAPLSYPYNNFISKNLFNQTEFVDPATPFSPDKLKLIMSTGSLEGVTIDAENSYKAADGLVRFSWIGVPKASGLASDNAVIVVYDIGTKYAYINTDYTRGDANDSYNISPGLILANLVFIYFFWRMNGDKQLRSSSLAVSPTAG